MAELHSVAPVFVVFASCIAIKSRSCCSELKREEATIIKPLRKQPYGNWEFEVADLNGYVLVFSEEAK